MVITRAQLEAMIDHARAEFPNEACGLLAGLGDRVERLYPVKNADASPVHYTLDPGEQLAALTDIDDRGLELTGIYHSHTHTRAYPSATDVRMAQVSLRFYPDTQYVILSLAVPASPEVHAFRIEGETINEQPLEIEG